MLVYIVYMRTIGMMTAVDDAVGDVIVALKRRHMLNKSLIVFISDVGLRIGPTVTYLIS